MCFRPIELEKVIVCSKCGKTITHLPGMKPWENCPFCGEELTPSPPSGFTIHLESEQSTGETKNLGMIVAMDLEYKLPVDISPVKEGEYEVEYVPEGSYKFNEWITIGLVSMKDKKKNPATVMISGDGTLKVSYKA